MYKPGRYDLSLRCPAAPAACCMMEAGRCGRRSSSCLAVCSALPVGGICRVWLVKLLRGQTGINPSRSHMETGSAAVETKDLYISVPA